jgi:3-hydroxymyristoyl/3-hydroxydecanoyl-(acyl carrier protein) dehydratase
MTETDLRAPTELEAAFVADCPYGPEGIIVDKILEVDRDAARIVARMPCHADLPLTRTQRSHPILHPRHVAGGLMVHVTGIVGFAHAYYVLDVRHQEGWIGFGARIHSARFRALAEPGEPLLIECRATRLRKGPRRILGRYDFRFTQAGKLVYEGDQTAMFMRILEGEALPEIAD